MVTAIAFLLRGQNMYCLSFLFWFVLPFYVVAGQDNAAGVSLDAVKTLPRLQDRDQARAGRFGSGGRGGFSDRRFGSGGRGGFSGGRGGRGGFSDRRNDRFSKGQGGRGYGNNSSKW